jgi:trimethylamine--corrinoid protein Co-methyltransferase
VADEQYVIDDEINGMVLRALRGIETDGEALALAAIARAAGRGDYLTDEHTLQHVRGEFFMPRVADRQPREKWEAQGAKDARARAREMAREIVATHRPVPIPAATDRAIREALPGLVA